jgi:ribosome recycling factor
MDELKKDEKDGKISKDLHHDQGQEIQVMTDDFIKKVDESLDNKEKEIMQV